MRRCRGMGWAGTVFLVLACLGTAAAMEEEPATIRSDVSVWLGADGVPTHVEVDEALPAAIGRIVAARAIDWRFRMPQVEGQPSGGLTHVRLFVCVVPEAGGRYAIRTHYAGHGPLLLAQRAGVGPAYPSQEAWTGQEASFLVRYVVKRDGTVALESLEAIKDSKRPAAFESVIRAWLDGHEYSPEEVAGLAIETSLSTTVDFRLGGIPKTVHLFLGQSPPQQDLPAWPRDEEGCELPDVRARRADSPFEWLGGKEA